MLQRLRVLNNRIGEIVADMTAVLEWFMGLKQLESRSLCESMSNPSVDGISWDG